MDGFKKSYTKLFSVCAEWWFQNDLYWDDWSRMGIFKAPKAGSHNNELIVGRLTGVMDLKIFYKGKNRGKEHSSASLWSGAKGSGLGSDLISPDQGITPVLTSHAVCCVCHSPATDTPVFVRTARRLWPWPMESCSASVPLVTNSKTTPASNLVRVKSHSRGLRRRSASFLWIIYGLVHPEQRNLSN